MDRGRRVPARSSTGGLPAPVDDSPCEGYRYSEMVSQFPEAPFFRILFPKADHFRLLFVAQDWRGATTSDLCGKKGISDCAVVDAEELAESGHCPVPTGFRIDSVGIEGPHIGDVIIAE